MEELKKYLIRLNHAEKNILIDIVRERRYAVISLWNQLITKQYDDDIDVYVDALEQGALVAIIHQYRDSLPEVWKQLMDLKDKLRKDAEVKVVDLGNNMIRLTDKYGISIIREKYEWENDI